MKLALVCARAAVTSSYAGKDDYHCCGLQDFVLVFYMCLLTLSPLFDPWSEVDCGREESMRMCTFENSARTWSFPTPHRSHLIPRNTG